MLLLTCIHACCVPASVLRLSNETLSGLPEPMWSPKTKHSNHEQDSSAVLIIGNELLNWGSSRDLLRAGTENFLTLKELSSFKPHQHGTQMDCQPALGPPASACERWEGGVHPKHICLTLHARICYLLGTQI